MKIIDKQKNLIDVRWFFPVTSEQLDLKWDSVVDGTFVVHPFMGDDEMAGIDFFDYVICN